MSLVSILIADHYPINRRGLRDLLQSYQAWKIVGEASDGCDAVAQAISLRPNVALLNLVLPKLNAIEAARVISQASPNTRVLLLGAQFWQEDVHKEIEAGVSGFIPLADVEAEIMPAVQRTLQHEIFLPPNISNTFFCPSRRSAIKSAGLALTKREKEIVQLLSGGNTNKKVASILNISTRTVENHRDRIMDKLGLHSFSDLLRYAIRTKMVE